MAQGQRLLAEHFQLRCIPASPWQRSATCPLPYLAASDAERLAALHQALADPEVEAIFCARGGYGTMRLLADIPLERIRHNPKPLIGFSDISALHGLWQRAGVRSIHGPVVNQLPALELADRQQLWDLLLRGRSPALAGLESVRSGRAAGPLYATNLAMLAATAGTPYAPRLAGCIVVLEDVGEAPYRLDRLLTQLLLADTLQGVAALVLGAFIDCSGPQGVPPLACGAEEVVRERLSGLGVPVAAGAPVGHGRRNVALPLGEPYGLDTAAGSLHPLAASEGRCGGR